MHVMCTLGPANPGEARMAVRSTGIMLHGVCAASVARPMDRTRGSASAARANASGGPGSAELEVRGWREGGDEPRATGQHPISLWSR